MLDIEHNEEWSRTECGMGNGIEGGEFTKVTIIPFVPVKELSICHRDTEVTEVGNMIEYGDSDLFRVNPISSDQLQEKNGAGGECGADFSTQRRKDAKAQGCGN